MPGVGFGAVRCMVSMTQVLERIGFYPPSAAVTSFVAHVLCIDQTRRKAVRARQIRGEMPIRVSNAAPRVTRLICGRP